MARFRLTLLVEMFNDRFDLSRKHHAGSCWKYIQWAFERSRDSTQYSEARGISAVTLGSFSFEHGVWAYTRSSVDDLVVP